MKYSILTFLAVALLFVSCKDDDNDCTTCNYADPFFGLNVKTDLCQEGDDVLVKTTALGVTGDSLYLNTTVSELVIEFKADGATCD